MKTRIYIPSIDRKVLGTLLALIVLFTSLILGVDTEKAIDHCINSGYEEIHGSGYCSDTLRE